VRRRRLRGTKPAGEKVGCDGDAMGGVKERRRGCRREVERLSRQKVGGKGQRTPKNHKFPFRSASYASYAQRPPQASAPSFHHLD
jgi:hypothetical protein